MKLTGLVWPVLVGACRDLASSNSLGIYHPFIIGSGPLAEFSKQRKCHSASDGYSSYHSLIVKNFSLPLIHETIPNISQRE